MKKVVYVCVDECYPTGRACHVFTEEEDAKEWCLEQYRHRYGKFWNEEAKEFESEQAFIEYLTSGEAYPFTFHDVDCD